MKYIFPQVVPGDNNLRFVFPSMQRDVQLVIDEAKNIGKINRVIVFGSAVTKKCGAMSDLDIAIDAPLVLDDDEFIRTVRSLRKAVNVDMDIIHYNSIKSKLLREEIDSKGVCVYDNRL